MNLIKNRFNGSIRSPELLSNITKPKEENISPSTSKQRCRAPISKFTISAVITFIIILAQIFLFYFYVGLDISSFSRITNTNPTSKVLKKEWKCMLSQISYIYDLAYKFNLKLVIIDPDILLMIDDVNSPKSQLDTITFSGTTRNSQESSYKSLVHLAAINETSGGQPNLKLFFDSLKHNGYFAIKYVDSSQMQPEVYSREPQFFDDMLQDGLLEHKHSHYAKDAKHSSIPLEVPDVSHGRISKIYTEFISHIFILNQTTSKAGFQNTEEVRNCESQQYVVIHIIVLYNYEFDPDNQWIQSGLTLDEMDKHMLLSYNVHSFDFRIPLEHYRIHPKHEVSALILPNIRKKKTLDLVQVFEPKSNRALRFVNNSYIHCAISHFNISGLREGNTSKYLTIIDNSRPIHSTSNLIQGQIMKALDFMEVLSTTYGNFSFWLTGSTLLSYYRFCDLASVSVSEKTTIRFQENHKDNEQNNDSLINLEFGLFSTELPAQVLDSLAESHEIGIVMLSNWHKDNSHVTFKLKECSHLILKLYLYELRKDFYRHYYYTRNTMIMSQKFNRKLLTGTKNSNSGHHVFITENLELCWTRIKNFNPFRVPCNIYDHLRRIYLV